MSLETRPWGGLYYYHGRKVGGRVVKTYVAAGRAALEAARIAEEDRAERQERSTERLLALAAFDAEETMLDDLCQRTERLVQATLLGAGYRRHDRGEWRRRRERNDVTG